MRYWTRALSERVLGFLEVGGERRAVLACVPKAFLRKTVAPSNAETAHNRTLVSPESRLEYITSLCGP